VPLEQKKTGIWRVASARICVHHD